MLTFIRKIPLILKKEKMLKILDKNTYSLIDVYPNKIKKFYVNVEREFRENNIARVDNRYDITRNKLRRMLKYKNVWEWDLFEKADVFWDKVKSIEANGIYDTYDIEVEDTNNYVSNGLVTHNSSLISCILPIWCTVYNKKSFILILSDTLGQASDFLADIRRELESNVRLQRDFPHACGKGSTWRVDEIVTRNDVKILALGSGSKIRGRRFGTKRPDLILLDDIENLEMVKSDTQRTDLKKWFDDDVMFVGGESGTKLDIFAVGTILGKEALLTSLVDPTKYPNFQSKVFSAVEKFSSSDLWAEWESLFTDPLDKDREVTARNFFEEHKEQMLRGTKVLWPEGDPYYDLMVNKLVNPSGFLAEKMNSPIDYTRVKVRREELHFKDFRDPYMQNLLNECPTFGAIDPSLGKNVKSGDFSAIVTMKRDKNTGLIYVPDIIMKRLDPDRQIDIILDLHEKRFFKLFGVETNAFQIILANLLRAKSRKRGSYLPIKEIQNYSDKVMRLEGIFPFIKDGTIIFDEYKYKHNRVYRNAIEQLLAYTGGKNERDDFIDALQMCFSIIRGTTFKMLTKQTGYRRRYAH
ncbi:MAG TPA: hypothetical protein ENI36_03630 [Thermoplasmatales archaeon]|nr:hypothetical protein [Thermoplasmatales archaeon]